MLGWIFKPFINYGHREVLHHPAWGVVVLVLPIWELIQYFDIGLGMWFFVGAVFAIEGHIVNDWVYSRWNKWLKL